MKYTISVIDTEEKFRDKFGSAPHWHISIPQNNETKPPAEKADWVFLCAECLIQVKKTFEATYQYGGTWKSEKR